MVLIKKMFHMCVLFFLIIDHFHKAKLCPHLHFYFLNIMIFLTYKKKIHLWSKVIFLFCLYLWNAPNKDASDCVLDLFWKLSRRKGASAWFHGIWTCGEEVLEYWTIFSLEIKLNHSWKFQRNWNVPLMLFERSMSRI